MEASDGGLYAVKFQNNPQSARALASEFLATRLGLWLGLPMPQVEIIQISDWLVTHDLLRIETDNRLTRCASGRQLAFRYMPDALEHLPRGLFDRVTNREDFIRVLPFDKWTGNCDNRQAVFVRQGKQYRAILIDQHQCLDAGRWRFPDLPHHGLHQHRHVYRDVTGWNSFEPAVSRIEGIDRFGLWQFALELPSEWYSHDTQALSRVVERLYKRRNSIRDLITRLRHSANNPFPNWPR